MGLPREDIEEIARATAQKVLQDLRHYAIKYQDPITVLDGVMDSMAEENKAAVWYRRRAADAREKQDPTTAELYEHIAQEEDQHHQEFKERLGTILGLRHGGKALKHEITPLTPEVTEKEARYGFLQLSEAEYGEALKSGRYPEPTRYAKLTGYITEPHEPGWKGLSLAEMFPTKYKELLNRGVPDKLSPLEVKTVIEEKRIPYGRGVELAKATLKGE